MKYVVIFLTAFVLWTHFAPQVLDAYRAHSHVRAWLEANPDREGCIEGELVVRPHISISALWSNWHVYCTNMEWDMKNYIRF